MSPLRNKAWRQFAACLLSLALCLQLVLGGAAPLRLAAADPLAAFGEHALCLAAGHDGDASPQAPVPADPGQGQHHHGPFCCLWHFLPALQPIAADTPQPVAYAGVVPGIPREAYPPPTPIYRPANARAPPPIV